MESQLIVKTSSSSSSMLFPVTVKRPSFTSGLPIPRVLNYRQQWNYPRIVAVDFSRQSNNNNNNNNNVGSIIIVPKTRLSANAFSERDTHQSESTVVSNSLWETLQKKLDVFCRFARLNVIVGTAVGIISMSFLGLEKISDISPLFLTGMLEISRTLNQAAHVLTRAAGSIRKLANVAAAFMNIYVVGLNQLCDIEIDKVNKPHRPLASGEYSVKTGAIIVVSAVVASLSIPMFVGSWPLFCALFTSFVLGITYSVDLPFLRWKRSALITALCMVVGKPITQIGYYLHMQTHVLGRPVNFSKPLIFAVSIMGLFSLVFALFKDIPDVAGDKVDGIQSVAVLLGQKRVFWICVSLLGIAYIVAILMGVPLCSTAWTKYFTVTSHAAMALILWNRVRSFDYSGPAAYESFYMFIWKLYCVEYFLVQFVR